MNTKILKIDSKNIDNHKLSYAANVIKSGGLVAFPTETVYGLGCNGLDEKAVNKIFLAKGRPSDNPLILHVSDLEMANKLSTGIDDHVKKILGHFWPGPLTIVVNRSSIVPNISTAGLNTVGLRQPNHPVALELIKASNVPLAGPSANSSGKPSPTRAKHVIQDLIGKVDVIIDSGFCEVGVESTVLDTTSSPLTILRPGGILLEDLVNIHKNITIDKALKDPTNKDFVPKSPGMKYTHYSPKAKVIVVKGDLYKVTNKINQLIYANESKYKKFGVLATDETYFSYSKVDIISLGSRANPNSLATNLFDALRLFDEKNVDLIIAEAIDESGIGLAVMNRMLKASGYNIVTV